MLARLRTVFAFGGRKIQHNYSIKNGAFLVENAPKRPSNAWAIFTKVNSNTLQGKVAERQKILGQKWKNSPQLHKEYVELAQEQSGIYKKKSQQHQAKWQVPFKRLTLDNYCMVKATRALKIESGHQNIGVYPKATKEWTSKLSEADKKAVEREHSQIVSQREKQRQHYRFPVLKYSGVRDFSSQTKKEGKAQTPEEKKKAYEKYVEGWKKDVTAWLKKESYQISSQEFFSLHASDARKQKAIKKEKEEKSEAAKKAREARVKKAAKKIKKVAKTKKAAATKKKAVKKVAKKTVAKKKTVTKRKTAAKK